MTEQPGNNKPESQKPGSAKPESERQGAGDTSARGRIRSVQSSQRPSRNVFGMRGFLALVGISGIFAVIAAILLIPASAWLSGTKLRASSLQSPSTPSASAFFTQSAMAPGSERDRWSLATSSPSVSVQAQLGNPSSGAGLAWLIVRGERPPQRPLVADAAEQDAKPPSEPDARQPAALLLVPPPESASASEGAKAVAIFPAAPDALAAWGNEVVLVFVDRPVIPAAEETQTATKQGEGKTAEKKRTFAVRPPQMSTVVGYHATERNQRWVLDAASTGATSYPPLPAARPVYGLAFAAAMSQNSKREEPVLFALLGPAVDVPARAPEIELFMYAGAGWTNLRQPWKQFESSKLADSHVLSNPLAIASVPGGVAMVMPGREGVIVANVPSLTQGEQQESNWLTLQEDDDWTVGQQQGESISQARAKQLEEKLFWREVALPAPAHGLSQMLWAGDQVLLLQPDDGAAGELGTGDRAPRTLRIYRMSASAFASEATDAHVWSLLSEPAGDVSDSFSKPWLVGMPGVARATLWWSKEGMSSLGGIRPQQAVQLSLATGLEFSQGDLEIAPPAGGADVRFVAGLLTYVVGLVAVLLVPRPTPGVLVLPKDASMASPVRRFAAGLIDLAVAVVLGSTLVGESPLDVIASSVADMLFSRDGQEVLLAILGSAVVLNASLESLTGRSVGKFVMGIGVARLMPGATTNPAQGSASEGGSPHISSDPLLDEHTYLAPALHRSLLRNIVKWCLFPLGFIVAIRPGASHKGDELAQCAVIDPAPIDDEDDLGE